MNMLQNLTDRQCELLITYALIYATPAVIVLSLSITLARQYRELRPAKVGIIFLGITIALFSAKVLFLVMLFHEDRIFSTEVAYMEWYFVVMFQLLLWALTFAVCAYLLFSYPVEIFRDKDMPVFWMALRQVSGLLAIILMGVSVAAMVIFAAFTFICFP